MNFYQEIRYNTNPRDAKTYDTARLREEYVVQGLFQPDSIKLVYTHYDRMIAGGALPVKEALQLKPMDYQKAEYFLMRREMGIFNVGGAGEVIADNDQYDLNFKEALYIGKGARDITLKSKDPNNPAKFYINSALAHAVYPNKKVTESEANPVYLGSEENSNKRTLNQYIAPGLVETCQLMLGYTDVKSGSAWNTMPCHLHPLRMEAYFYFELPKDQAVCHIMGQPDETRNLWLANEEAVISPSWSIHNAAGTASYSFVWGMAGSDSEMDPVAITDMR